MPLKTLLGQRDSPDAVVLLCDGVAYSRKDVLREVQRAAGKLSAAGVSRGSKVLLALPNEPSFVVALLAANDCGAVVIPVNPKLSRDVRGRIDALAQPDITIAETGDIELWPKVYCSRPRQGNPNDELSDVAVIIFTSGTTGTPKGVMLSEAALLANAHAVSAYLHLSENDRTLVFLPLSYAYALSQMLSTLVAGGGIVLLDGLRYPKLAFQAIATQGVTGLGGVPTSLAILARHQAAANAPLGSLRYILSAGGPLSGSLVNSVRQVFPGVALFNNYGCTEIGPRATAINLDEYPHRVDSIGRPVPGVELRIVRPDLSVAEIGETGEIVLNGPSVMKGYYRDPDGTAARLSSYGFHTGDYAYADAEGFLHYQGRADDIFKSAGEKISAREVEEVVLAHDHIAEAAVISQPDDLLGAVPIVYAVLRPGSSCTDRELQAFCASRLARHKVPRAVHFVEALRKTDTGKIQKHWLRHTSAPAPTPQ